MVYIMCSKLKIKQVQKRKYKQATLIEKLSRVYIQVARAVAAVGTEQKHGELGTKVFIWLYQL